MGRDGTGVKPASRSSIEISFVFQGHRCRERIPLRPTAANLKRVTDQRSAILDEIAQGRFNYEATFGKSKKLSRETSCGGPVTTGDYLEQWLEIKRTQIKASTLRDYEGIIYGLLIPKFGHELLTELRRPVIKKWLAGIDAQHPHKLSNKRLANIQSCLRTALSDALDDELIPVNPLHGYTFSRLEPPREKDYADPMDSKEQAAIIANARHPQIANLFQFAFWSGLRTSELVALDWRDIDEARGVLRVRRATTRAAKGAAEAPKTRAGRREVKLLAPALNALDKQRQYTHNLNAEVFQHPGWNGKPPARWKGDDEIWETWGTAIRAAGVRYRNPYQTRHTYASMMLSAGEHPMWVATQMGHSDTTSIMRNYGRWIPSSNPDAGNKAVALFAYTTGE